MTQTAKLTSSNAGFLGASVAIEGNTIVSGATDDTSSGGQVCLYVQPDGGWRDMTETAALSYAHFDALGFGSSVTIRGNTVIVGAPAYYDYGSPTPGAFVFVMPSGGWTSMTQNAILTSSDGFPQDHFGASVGTTENTVIVSAPSINEVYVYEEPQGGWVNTTETARLTSSDSGREDDFGASLALKENAVAIGSPANNGLGAAYLYLKPRSGWQITSQYTAKAQFSLPGQDLVGSIAFGERAIVVGAPFETVDGYYNQGATYLFFRAGSETAATGTRLK